jgi:flagellar hook assembly protein FlgD
MPGVRLSATPRGLRMGLGPRAGRIHVGSGRPTISTGAGPATVWTGIGPSRRRSRRRASTRPQPTANASASTSSRAADLVGQVEHLAALEAALVSVHRDDFPPVERELAEPPAGVDEQSIRRRATGEALAGISLFAFGKRAEARQQAKAVAEERIRQAHEARAQAQAAEQARLDEHWRRLQANDPETVLSDLEAAFEDNQAPAVPIDCTGDAVAIVMLYPSADQIPEQKAALTPTGRPTVHKRSQTDRNTLHVQSMASHILATVREAFAVAPAIQRVVVLTVEKSDAVGGVAMLRAVAANGFDRGQVERFNWERLDPLATIEAANPSLIKRRGRTGELAPLDLTDEPDIATVLVTCAALLDVQVDPRVRIPPGTTPHVPDPDDDPPAEAGPTPPPAEAAPAEPSGSHHSPSGRPDRPPSSGAWSRFRASRWWVQAIAWLLVSPVLASWWCWRRPWPVWGRLVAIAAIVLASLTLAGSFSSSNASNTADTSPATPPTTATTAPASQPSATTASSPPPKPPITAQASRDVFNPLEQDGYRDTIPISFRTTTADTDSIRVINARGKVIRIADLGRLSAKHHHLWRWDGRTSGGALAAPGAYSVRVIARHAGHASTAPAVTITLRPLAPSIGDVSVSPSPFYPIEQDGYRDTTTITFVTTTNSRDTIRVRGPGGRIIRTVSLGTLTAHARHTGAWDGRNNAGQTASPGTYRIQVSAAYYNLHAASTWHAVKIKRKATTLEGGGARDGAEPRSRCRSCDQDRCPALGCGRGIGGRRRHEQCSEGPGHSSSYLQVPEECRQCAARRRLTKSV